MLAAATVTTAAARSSSLAPVRRRRQNTSLVPKGYPRLKAAIVLAGKRHLDIAEPAGLSVKRLSEIICGRGKPPTAQEQRNLAGALKRPIETLFPDSDL